MLLCHDRSSIAKYVVYNGFTSQQGSAKKKRPPRSFLAAGEAGAKEAGSDSERSGLILGGGPNAFQKYESAEVVTSQAISNLLRLLAHDPSGLEVLRREIAPRSARAAEAAM